MALNERDMDILDELRAATDDHVRLGLSGWVTPMECGGSNGSDHSYRLTKLALNGAADQKQRTSLGARGSKLYRVNDAGRTLLASWKERQKEAERNAAD